MPAFLPRAGTRVAEIVAERVIPNVKHPLGEVALTRHREVPRQEQLAARYPGPRCKREQLLHVRLARIGVRRGAVAIGAEGVARRDLLAGRVEHPPERHDVACPLLEVDRRAQDQGAVGVGCRVGIELRPEGMALPRLGVDHGHVGGEIDRARDVGDRRRVRLGEIDTGDVSQHHGPGAEPVVAIPLRGIDGLAEDRPGHRRN
jgi:hypothetical protein